MLDRRGLDHPRATHSAEVRAEAMRLRYEERLLQAEIAARLGCCRQTVIRWCREHERGFVERAEVRQFAAGISAKV